MKPALNQFLWGATCTLSFVAGLFFWQYYRRAKDRLFVFFALAFWALAVHWLAIAFFNPTDDERHYFFLIRLLAFVLILVGIIDKNRRS